MIAYAQPANSLCSRTGADAAFGAIANQRAALVLQVGKIGRIAATIVIERNFRHPGDAVSVLFLAQSAAREQIVLGRDHIARKVALVPANSLHPRTKSIRNRLP
jgi:hypothetical protein